MDFPRWANLKQCACVLLSSGTEKLQEPLMLIYFSADMLTFFVTLLFLLPPNVTKYQVKIVFMDCIKDPWCIENILLLDIVNRCKYDVLQEWMINSRTLSSRGIFHCSSRYDGYCPQYSCAGFQNPNSICFQCLIQNWNLFCKTDFICPFQLSAPSIAKSL